MARTESTMLELGTMAPDFSLTDYSGGKVCRNDFQGKEGLLVIFVCNHCPYVLHINHELAKFAREYQARGLGVVAISSNDVDNYPDDSPEKMADIVKKYDYTFPYLYDETQEIAKAYKAACTPDLYLFDKDLKLVYRGQFDASRPKNDVTVTGEDLRTATDALLSGEPAPAEQMPSMGCNIKWKPGNEPDYFG